MRRALALLGVGLVALAVVLALGGRGGGGGGEDRGATAARERPSDADALDALLEKRGRALSERNAGALARTTAPGPLRAADRRRVARLGGLHLASVRYVPTDLTFDRRRARITVFETYRVRGVPGSLFSVRRTLPRG